MIIDDDHISDFRYPKGTWCLKHLVIDLRVVSCWEWLQRKQPPYPTHQRLQLHSNCHFFKCTNFLVSRRSCPLCLRNIRGILVASSPQTVHTTLEISCNCSKLVREPYFINVSKHRLESATGPLRQSHMPLLQKTSCLMQNQVPAKSAKSSKILMTESNVHSACSWSMRLSPQLWPLILC